MNNLSIFLGRRGRRPLHAQQIILKHNLYFMIIQD